MKDKKRWLIDTLLPQFNASLSANLSYLHNTLTWTVTIVTAGIIATLHYDKFPDLLSFVSLNILLVLLVHFSIRSGKAYLNVVRYGVLDKQIVKYQLERIETETNSDDTVDNEFETLKDKILKYHCDWVSPLTKATVIKKVFFELGFFYFIGLNIVAIIYVVWSLKWDSTCIIISLLTVIVVMFEIFWGLLGSGYFKVTEQDSHARKIK